MKKFYVCISIIFVVLLCSFCFAKVGDKVGSVYSTDIKAYINDVPVVAYNIGGRTCVAIEEVTNGYAYNNYHRALLVDSFSPELLKRDTSSTKTTSIGKVVGTLYSTDIKTFFYDKEMTAYNIGGKTCVAIEDIGNDGKFSDIGGKYTWNPKDRTIKLEYMYSNTDEISNILKKYNYVLNIDCGKVTFVPDSVSSGLITTDFSKMYTKDSDRPEIIIDLFCDATLTGESMTQGLVSTIGYNFGRNTKQYYVENDHEKPKLEDSYYTFNYFYKDIIEKILGNEGAPNFSREEVVNELLDSGMGTLKDRFDTDNYTFLYYSQPTPRGTNEVICYVRNNGSYTTFTDEIDSIVGSTRKFESVEINKEAETVTVKVSGNEAIYTIDLKTEKVTN